MTPEDSVDDGVDESVVSSDGRGLFARYGCSANIRMTIEYDGSRFYGWQKQPKVRTVHEALHRAIEVVLREKIPFVNASGRTDAGVHARGQVVNFICNQRPDLARLARAVSAILKNEVAVLDAQFVPESFHACRDAIRKQYSYRILHRSVPAVLDRKFAWSIVVPLDYEKMRHAAEVLVGTHDFSSFRAAGCDSPSPVKEIFESAVTIEPPYVMYRVVGSGFMKQMVRTIVGSLVVHGKGRARFDSMEQLLAARDRGLAGFTAPAHGLCLDWVEYPA